MHALYLAIKANRQLAAVPKGMLEIKGAEQQGKETFWYSFPPVSLEILEGIADEIERAPKRNPAAAKESPRANNLRAAIARIKSGSKPI